MSKVSIHQSPKMEILMKPMHKWENKKEKLFGRIVLSFIVFYYLRSDNRIKKENYHLIRQYDEHSQTFEMGMQGMDGTSATGYAHANDMGANGVFVCETQWGDNKTIDGRKHTGGIARGK
ncbi:MAG: hypothetical protein II570_04250 [Bacteroidaceae bacterium]|nr:hypothetical protein [Bacteroidaceae bacterium]